MTVHKSTAYLFVGSVVVLALLLAIQPAQVNADDDDRESIAGTWVVTVIPSTPAGAPPYRELIAFGAGNALTATSELFNAHSSLNPFLPPPLAVDTSDGYGAWRRVGANEFALTFKRLLFAGADTPAAVYGSFFPGQSVGVANIEASVTIRGGSVGDTVDGFYSFQVINLRGEVVFNGNGRASGTRLKVEPRVRP